MFLQVLHFFMTSGFFHRYVRKDLLEKSNVKAIKIFFFFFIYIFNLKTPRANLLYQIDYSIHFSLVLLNEFLVRMRMYMLALISSCRIGKKKE
jgi:hypothetical protein